MTRPHRISAGRRRRRARWRAACLLLVAMPWVPARGDETPLRLAAPPPARALVAYLLPRFTLKTGRRAVLSAPSTRAHLQVTRAAAGIPAFRGPGGDWFLTAPPGARHDNADRFVNWLRGTGGRNAIAAFRGQGGVVFRPPPAAVTALAGPVLVGDPVAGEELAERHCGRCHMVNERTRMTTIGATPSFALLRGLADWRHRFETFYSLNPHPAFTQVAGVTPPFDESRPPPIVPLRLTVAEIYAILAYIAGLAPADLGRPLIAR